MGQRSQIYVRIATGTENKKYALYARYYPWNFAERMISRCRHTIDWLIDSLSISFINVEKLVRIMDTNFDLKDCVISQDIIKEWQDGFQEESSSNFIFYLQNNNDGKLFLDIVQRENPKDVPIIKYAFLNYDADLDNIMDAEAYMNWDLNRWQEILNAKDKEICMENISKIRKNAQLMTKEELIDFINSDYENIVRIKYTWDMLYQRADGAACGEPTQRAKDTARENLRNIILSKSGYDIEEEEIPEEAIDDFLENNDEIIFFDEDGNLI